MILSIINTVCLVILITVFMLQYSRLSEIEKKAEQADKKCNVAGLTRNIDLLDEKVRKLYEWYVSREEMHTFTKQVVTDAIDTRFHNEQTIILSDVLKTLICEAAKQTNTFADIATLVSNFVFVIIDQIHLLSVGKNVCMMPLEEFHSYLRKVLGAGIVNILSSRAATHENFSTPQPTLVLNVANMQPQVNSSIVMWMYNLIKSSCANGVVSLDAIQSKMHEHSEVFSQLSMYCTSSRG